MWADDPAGLAAASSSAAPSPAASAASGAASGAASAAASAADSASATFAAFAAATAAAWVRLSKDATAIDGGISPHNLMGQPVWPEGTPLGVAELWSDLKRILLSLDQDWQVWTNWYDDRLRGAAHPDARPLIAELELKRILIPDAVWDEGPSVVNSRIAELEAEYREILDLDADGALEEETFATRFRDFGSKIDADDLADADAVSSDPDSAQNHAEIKQLAQELLSATEPLDVQTNQPGAVRALALDLIEAAGLRVDAMQPRPFVLRAGRLQSELEADDKRIIDSGLEGPPLSADQRRSLQNLCDACRTLINLDPFLAKIDAARRGTSSTIVEPGLVSEIVSAAVAAGAATQSAQAAIEEAQQTGETTPYYTNTVVNFFRRALKIAKGTIATVGAANAVAAAVVTGTQVAKMLVTNQAAILTVLEGFPAIKAIAEAIIGILRTMVL